MLPAVGVCTGHPGKRAQLEARSTRHLSAVCGQDGCSEPGRRRPISDRAQKAPPAHLGPGRRLRLGRRERLQPRPHSPCGADTRHALFNAGGTPSWEPSRAIGGQPDP